MFELYAESKIIRPVGGQDSRPVAVAGKDRLLKTHGSTPELQIGTSVVPANNGWFARRVESAVG